jgi:16S rRNA (adenine1518-N6/adenine1519-N6)-dimethyltransferase
MIYKKQLGQNFIYNQKIQEKIASSYDMKGLDVIEIGSGLGNLTIELAKRCHHLVTYEIDRSLEPKLLNVLKPYSNIEVKFQDYLISDLSSYPTYSVLVGNIPYYITSPIINSFIYNPNFKVALLLMQKELAYRCCAPSNSSEVGVLSTSIKHVANSSILFNLDKANFFPVPNVDSSLVLFQKKENIDYSHLKSFNEFLKIIFKQKRKTLYNNLTLETDDKTKVINLLNELNLDRNIRSEQLELNTILKLEELWSKN